MKMFLTRIGFGSSAIVTGDITQTDLPKGSKSGLLDAIEVLEGEKNISFSRFQSKDVVRHGLVQRIIEAYDSHEKEWNFHYPTQKISVNFPYPQKRKLSKP